MNIGDKVRLLHDKQQGIITRFLEKSVVEIEIEDGFRITVLRKEITVVNKEEDFVFGKLKREQEGNQPQIVGQSGIYMCFKPLPDNKVAMIFVNNTDLKVQLALFEQYEHSLYGHFCGLLEKRSHQQAIVLNFERVDLWRPYLLQGIVFMQGQGKVREPFQKRYTFKKNILLAAAGKMPVLGTEGYVIQIDDTEGNVDLPMPTADEIKTKMLEPKSSEKVFEPIRIAKPKPTVDLHIEQLIPNAKNISSAEIITTQLKVFERSLDNAIASNMDEIIFIHGAGNGILRQEIHKRLSGNPFIKYFEDAQKEKFGYGATLARLNN